jgi:hypothetical protein
MRNKISILVLAISLVIAFTEVSAQTTTFSDVNAPYTFDLPNGSWRLTARPSEMNTNVEYVFIERQSGHLEIRKLGTRSGMKIADVIAEEEEKLKFLQGYVAGKQESFAGNFRGMIFNYEFVRSGRNMSGRFYFLATGPDSFYVLRFTGLTDSLRTIRNQTDSIARTFELKK